MHWRPTFNVTPIHSRRWTSWRSRTRSSPKWRRSWLMATGPRHHKCHYILESIVIAIVQKGRTTEWDRAKLKSSWWSTMQFLGSTNEYHSGRKMSGGDSRTTIGTRPTSSPRKARRHTQVGCRSRRCSTGMRVSGWRHTAQPNRQGHSTTQACLRSTSSLTSRKPFANLSKKGAWKPACTLCPPQCLIRRPRCHSKNE